MRQLFGDGASVTAIANEVKRPVSVVREQLSKWTKLKHDLDEDIEEHGFDGSQLLKRCASEKLDLNKLLNAKRKKELQAGIKRS